MLPHNFAGGCGTKWTVQKCGAIGRNFPNFCGKFFKISNDWYSFSYVCWHLYWSKWLLSLTLKLTAASFIHRSLRIRDQQLYVPVRLTSQVWASSRGWWRTGKPGMLQSTGSQRVGHNWATELSWAEWRVGETNVALYLPVCIWRSW